ncbi:QueT transporter family protein [Metabacillus sp. GX 13764]|uniref:QueT transporter family protein n=1 Tax=Metabacillus kandeliae TaxID=2900151 RepID=UPI001E455D53|nr:QueT transporter family protein [Metabacillus kandeliae]MCD7034053.1 QueT transporter family protein [Metabacillus kandeliae]
MRLKTIVTSGILAALYIAFSFALTPLLTFGALQFRLGEMFNHLVVFNKKYFFGIIIGVFITNLFSPLGVYDLVFGLGQSVIALAITIAVSKFVSSYLVRMLINTAVFSVSMILVAWELNLALDLPFFATWLSTALCELAVMLLGIPLVTALNRKLKFKDRV